MNVRISAALFLLAMPCSAEVRLPKVLGSHMVLQRESDVKLWGWADPGEQVRIAADWLTDEIATTADARGNWHASVRTTKAGGPYRLTFHGRNTIELKEILFGEVWIGSGQSNMEMPLVKVSRAYTGVHNAEHEVGEADYPGIRLFQVGNFSSKAPLEDVEQGISMYGIPPAECRWQPVKPSSIPTFASTAYFFARELHKEIGVPIGIIDASWGGTSAESWTPASGLEALEYADALEKAGTLPQKPDSKVPTRLYNGMIHPLRHLRIRGVIWYQGEGNTPRADKYHKLFSTMIAGWRSAFDTDFPFYFVQISPFRYGKQNAALLREAQFATLATPRTGMAVTMDIGNLADIHPKNKQEVGRRLALWALARDYGRDVVYSGPLYRESLPERGSIRLRFNHTGGGLATRDGKPPSHFEVAGADRVFHPATAVIEGDEIIVSSDVVPAPKAARYAFRSDAEPNLMNREGLPASSFRTRPW